MNISKQNQFANEASSPAEATLRLIARLSAPEGLEERVQAGLRTAALAELTKARILRWPVALRLDNDWMQNLARAAAAAAIVAVVVGGGWSVSSRFQSAQPSSAIAVPLRGAGQTGQAGFSSAGAMRTPQTLNGPIVAHPATASPETGKTAVKKPVLRGKPTAAKKAVARTVPAEK